MEQTTVTVHEYYQGVDGGSYFSDNTNSVGRHQFDTFEEIRDAIKAFQENPRIHNPKMTDENVEYWKKKSYTIQKVVTTKIEITTL